MLKGIADKIRKYGILGSIELVINIVLFHIFTVLPINKKLIVFESEGDLCDNAFALFDFMVNNGYLPKYKIIWLVNDIEKAKTKFYENTEFVVKFPKRLEVRRSYYLATCQWYIYDHCDMIIKKRNNQKIIFLTHGAGFKANTKGKPCKADEIYSPGILFNQPISKWCRCDESKMVDIGYPRLDYFFQPLNKAQQDVIAKLNLKQYKKIALWMPTFRRSNYAEIDEKYFSSFTGLPILYDETSLKDFDNFLLEENVLCVFKIHHLQATMNAFQKKYTNILIINDNEICRYGLQLYQFIALTDFLITDYSSVSTDYILLDRPIIYTMDDYEQYKTSRGFSIENPEKYFIGYHVYTVDDLKNSFHECALGYDIFKKERNTVLPLMHSHVDGNASKRILDHLGILK